MMQMDDIFGWYFSFVTAYLSILRRDGNCSQIVRLLLWIRSFITLQMDVICAHITKPNVSCACINIRGALVADVSKNIRAKRSQNNRLQSGSSVPDADED